MIGIPTFISVNHTPALFFDGLEHLYTQKELGNAFNFLFDANENASEGEADEARIAKLCKDLESRTYIEIRAILGHRHWS